ncbi:hypothetical protein HQ520_04110 [bacterium]|nr:hypothetical protein [bacterium]
MVKQNSKVLEQLDELVGRFRNLFFNEKHRIGRQIRIKKEGKEIWAYLPEPAGNIEDRIREHLLGMETYAFPSHSATDTAKWIALDIDLRRGLLADHYMEILNLLHQIRKASQTLGIPQDALLADFSGSKGLHLWILLEETPLEKVQNLVRHVQLVMPILPTDVEIDWFPSPTTDPKKSKYGTQIKPPLGLHKQVQQFSHLIDDGGSGVLNSLDHLTRIKPCPIPDLPVISEAPKVRNKRRSTKRDPPKGTRATEPVGPVLSQPPLTDDLSLLFDGCKVLSDFQKHPQCAGYQEWKCAGMILSYLGEEGQEWFAYLSSKDQLRYDGSHESIVESVRERGYHPPTCQTMGCSHCGKTSPLESIRTERKRYRTFIKDQKAGTAEDAINLFDLQNDYRKELRRILTAGDTPIILNNMPLGGGKTTLTIEEIKSSGKKCVFFAPTHDLVDEVVEKFGKNVISVSGLDHLEETTGFRCPHKKDILESVKLGLSSGHYCKGKGGKCRIRKACPYLKQFEEASQAQAVILVHSHLSLGEEKRRLVFQNKDLAVVDEAFLHSYREEVTFTFSDIETLKEALRQTRTFQDLRTQLQTLSGRMNSSTLYPFHAFPKEFTQVDRHFRNVLSGRRNILRLLYAAAQKGIPIRRRGDLLTVNIPADLPDIPLLILDATATASDYDLLLGRKVKVINPAQGKTLKRYARTIQIISGGYSNSTLLTKSTSSNAEDLDETESPECSEMIQGTSLTESGERVLEFVQQRIRDQNDFGIICTKKMETFLLESRYFSPERILHFNSLRGLNTFSNVLDLFVIGYQGISFQDMVSQTRIFYDQEWIDEDMVSNLKDQKEYVQLKTSGNQGCEVLSLSPKNPCLKSFYDLCVRGEVEQAIGRSRIFSDCGKPDRKVYLITNIPTTIEIDRVLTLGTKERKSRSHQAAEELLAEKGSFTRKELSQRAGISKRYVQDVIKHLMIDLELIEETGAHGRKSYRKAPNSGAAGKE